MLCSNLGLQGGALDAEGGAINRENAGPLAGGRVVVEAMLEHEAARLPGYAALVHNGDLSYACTATLTFFYIFNMIFDPFPPHHPLLTTLHAPCCVIYWGTVVIGR